jgi:hypothetical protein
MTVLIAVTGTDEQHEIPGIVWSGEWEARVSYDGSIIMETAALNAVESATRFHLELEPEVLLRDAPVSDAAVLEWGRSLPRHPGAEGMVDLDI